MSDIHGRFIWYELMTPDIAGATAFYGKVLGWGAKETPMPGGPPYTLFDVNGAGVAGGMPMMPDVPMPNWTGYVAVDDVDASTGRVVGLGGSVMREPKDIPGVGRFAIVRDPGGAVLAIMTPAPMDQPRPEIPEGAFGGPAWHELYSGEPEQMFAFYEALFGWTKLDAFDMGPMGKYQLFASPTGRTGGMMKQPPQAPIAYWNYYFKVDGIETSARAVKAAGGQVLMGPMEVPSGDWVLQALDPQGATFALQGRKGG